MRKALNKRPLDALFPSTRQRILATTLLRPERAWYLSDLAKRLDVPPSSLQRELAALVDAEILVRREEGNLVYFQANPQNPLFGDLQRILVKTVGVADVLRLALEPFQDEIRAAFVYGSMATGRERSSSDVDLFIVGDLALSDLSESLPRVEEQLGRPVNPTIYSPAEFSKKARTGHHFIRSVLENERLFIIGGENDLAEAPRRRARRQARDKQARNR